MMFRLKTALLSAALALGLWAAPALATGIVPLSGSQQFDNSTSPPAFLNGGKLYVYSPGSTTCAAAYTDFGLTVLHPCPITLNSAGRVPAIYLADGSVRLRLTNSATVLQYDEDNVALVTAASTGSSTPIPDATQIYATGDVKFVFDDQPQSGFVRLNGRTIGSATSGASERANSDTQTLFLKLWPFANVSVVTGKGGSAAADWAANKQLTLPDFRGRLVGAVDDMGGGAASRITGITGSTVVGASGGAQSNTIAQANLPSYTLPDTLGISDTRTWATTNLVSLYFQNGVGPGSVGGGANANSAASIGVSVTGGSITKTGTVTSGGSGTALTILPPAMLLTAYMRL